MRGDASERIERKQAKKAAAVDAAREAAGQYLDAESWFTRYKSSRAMLRAYRKREPINPGASTGENPNVTEGGPVAFLARKILAEAVSHEGLTEPEEPVPQEEISSPNILGNVATEAIIAKSVD